VRRVRRQLTRDIHWYVRVAGKCYAGATKNEIAQALTTAPGRLPNSFRRRLRALVPVEGWFPERLVAGQAPDGERMDEGLARRIIQILGQAIGKDGADLDDESGFHERRRRAGLTRSLRLADSLVQTTTDDALAAFYRGFAESLR